jgi:Cof subfamily protein (haloacid dehalogenase superfamily)
MTVSCDVVALDLDGTLLRPDATLSPYSAAVLRAIVERGVRLVYVTARHLTALRRVIGHLDLPAHAICCAGAAVYELPSGREVAERTIEPEAVRRIAKRVDALLPDASFAWVLGADIHVQRGYPDSLATSRMTDATDALPDVPTSKLSIRATEVDPSDFDRAVLDAVDGIAQVVHWRPGFADVVALGVDKGVVLREWCDVWCVGPKQVVSFGDAAADIPMLRWSGRGVAVGNAEPGVLAAADEITGSCDEDGVAVWLRTALLPADWTVPARALDA